MGLFCCCFKPKVFNTESKRILEDRIERNEVPIRDQSEVVATVSSLHQKPSINLSEQTLFDITVQKMSSKMINIPALNNELPQFFWKQKQESYERRLNTIRNPLRLRSDVEKSRLKSETSNHKQMNIFERISKIEAISKEDLKLINELSEKSSNAVKKGFDFWSDKPLVVEFDPNKM